MISELQRAGWVLEGDVIRGHGIFFAPSHFDHWTPEEMHEIIGRRGERIAQQRQSPRWEQASEEHRQVCRAIEVMWKELG